MLREALLETLPPYYRLGTLADFSKAARKMAKANQAFMTIAEIEKILDIKRGKLSDEELSQAVEDVEMFAWRGVKFIGEVRAILADVRAKVEDYKEYF